MAGSLIGYTAHLLRCKRLTEESRQLQEAILRGPVIIGFDPATGDITRMGRRVGPFWVD